MKRRLGILLSLFVLLVVTSCAPKRVSLYCYPEGLRGGIVKSAMDLIGKPYMWGGKGPDAFDCSGLVHYVYRKNGVLLPGSTGDLMKVGFEVERDRALPGDLVFFNIKRDYHVGIMIDRRGFVHSSATRGVVVDDVDGAYWARRITAFRSPL